MTTLPWGQPLGGISQFAYVVEDIEQAIARYVEVFGIGPWFLRSRFQPRAGRYRGQPTSPTFSLARTFSGHAMLELIQQHDDSASVYRETGLGFHHWGIVTATFDADVARCARLGYEEAFFDILPSGARVVYVDSTRDLAGMIELIEHTREQERTYTEIYEAALHWDGLDPIRA
jgi:hypothetical protein